MKAKKEKPPFTKLCEELEHYETALWPVRCILDIEKLPGLVIDPCAGTGIMTKAARQHGYVTKAFDVHNWGFRLTKKASFFDITKKDIGARKFSVFMNPPFSMAVQFVQHSFSLGASKIVSFQRFAWWESQGRKEFWDNCPPDRVYICGDRAVCWRHDIPKDERGSSSPTAHAFFVWDTKTPFSGTKLGRIYKEGYE